MQMKFAARSESGAIHDSKAVIWNALKLSQQSVLTPEVFNHYFGGEYQDDLVITNASHDPNKPSGVYIRWIGDLEFTKSNVIATAMSWDPLDLYHDTTSGHIIEVPTYNDAVDYNTTGIFRLTEQTTNAVYNLFFFLPNPEEGHSSIVNQLPDIFNCTFVESEITFFSDSLPHDGKPWNEYTTISFNNTYSFCNSGMICKIGVHE